MNRWLLGLLAFSAFLPAVAFAQASPSDFTSATRYDELGRVTGTIAPDPDGAGSLHHLAVRNSYDLAGQLIRVEKGELEGWQPEGTPPKDWTGFTIHQTAETDYDAMGRKIVERLREGAGPIRQVTQYSYDADGRPECTAIRMNPAAFGSLPASACALGTAGSQGNDRITQNIYDAAGQLLQVRRAVGTSLEQAYVTYSYTPNGKQEYVVDANGNKARLIYDGLDRQAQWQFPSASAPGGFNGATPATALATAGAVNTGDYEAYGYDLNGNRTSLRKRDGRRIFYAVDALNRVMSKTYPDGGARAVYYDYNLRGLQTAARFDSASGADAVLSVWDGFGRQTSSTTNMAGTSRQLNYGYDANGNRIRVSHPDGHFIDYNRDGLDRLNYADLDAATVLFYPPYDAAGRVTALYRLNQASGAWTFGTNYGYDGISRLTGYGHSFSSGGNVSTTLGYNSASQIVTRARDNDDYRFNGYVNVNRNYAANGLNQYASAGGASFLYDANGNLTSDGTTGYGYDIENRLVSSSAGATLTYDPMGRLWQTYAPSYGATQFLYDGDALTAEYDGSGNMLKRYAHGTADGVDDPLVEYVGTSMSPRYLFADHQGSIIALTDASGNRIAVNSYDEYGIPAAGNSGRFQYTGQAWIPELGMYHYKARVYSPTLGRFLQTDPIGYDDQINLYAYVANDPMNMSDPSGQAGDCDWCKKVSSVLNSIRKEADPVRIAARVVAAIPGNGEGVDQVQKEIKEMIGDPIGTLAAASPAFIGSGIPIADPLVAPPAAAKGPTEAYNRAAHYGRTPTGADRRAVGAGPGQVADHTPPLVKRYYEGDPAIGEKPGWQMTPAERAASAADRTRMSPQPRAESDSQGGQMSAYSRTMKRKHGL